MGNGNIKVIEPTDDYKRIHKSLIRNKNIDCFTLGLYVKIVVLGAEWQLNIKGLSTILGLSDAKVRKSIGILESEGYIKRTPNRENGRLNGWTYTVYPTPLSDKERSNAGYAKIEKEEMQCCADFSVTEKQTTLKIDNTKNGEDNNIILNKDKDLINNKTNKEKEIKEKSDKMFEECWIAYRRKGESKKKAKEYWDKLTDEEKQLVIPHIKAYVATRELSFQKDFARYLRDKIFNSIVTKGNSVVYDPTHINDTNAPYTPITDGELRWNDYYKCYLFIGMFYENLVDGYTDDNRPNGATIVLNNARGTIVWNSETKKWEKK